MHAMLLISNKSGRCKTFGPTKALYTCGTNERMDDSHIKTINSSPPPPSVAYMRHLNGPALFQIMASKYKTFHSRKCI